MVFVIHDCVCGLCPGSQPSPPGVFGGSSCGCQCHTLTGKEREDFIKQQGKISCADSEPHIK